MRSVGERMPFSRAQWLKKLAQLRRDRIAFVFSGGGPLGAIQVGAARALLEDGIKPELVVGTSVGALNAAFMAFDPSLRGVEALEGVWQRLREEDLFPGGRFRTLWARMLVRGNRVFDNTGIRRLVETRLGSAWFEDATIPLGVVATELESGREALFTSGPILQPLLASTALPAIYPPVTIEGRAYIDGGVVNNVPIAPAADMGARTIYVLNATASSSQRRPLLRPMDYLMHAFSLARGQRLVVEQPYLAGSRLRIVVLPTPELDFYVPFASLVHTNHLIELGYQSARRFLDDRDAEAPSRRLQTSFAEAPLPAE